MHIAHSILTQKTIICKKDLNIGRYFHLELVYVSVKTNVCYRNVCFKFNKYENKCYIIVLCKNTTPLHIAEAATLHQLRIISIV